MTRSSPTALQVEGSLYWYHLNHCTRAIDREIEEAEDVQREEGDDPGEGPSGMVLFDINPPEQPGDGGPIRVPAYGESEPQQPQGGADVPPARDTGGQLDALDEYNPPTNEPHLLGNRDGISTIDFSHLSAD